MGRVETRETWRRKERRGTRLDGKVCFSVGRSDAVRRSMGQRIDMFMEYNKSGLHTVDLDAGEEARRSLEQRREERATERKHVMNEGIFDN